MLSKKTILGGALLSLSAVSFTHAAECDETALHDHMQTLKTELKSLAFEVKKQNYEAADERVDDIVKVLRVARDESPYLFKEKALSGDDLASRLADYQSVMDDTIAAFLALDTALQAEDDAKAKTMLGEIGNLRKKGHRAFKSDC